MNLRYISLLFAPFLLLFDMICFQSIFFNNIIFYVSIYLCTSWCTSSSDKIRKDIKQNIQKIFQFLKSCTKIETWATIILKALILLFQNIVRLNFIFHINVRNQKINKLFKRIVKKLNVFAKAYIIHKQEISSR
jgi:hypothetical protein